MNWFRRLFKRKFSLQPVYHQPDPVKEIVEWVKIDVLSDGEMVISTSKEMPNDQPLALTERANQQIYNEIKNPK